jgi:transposase InsO family protein
VQHRNARLTPVGRRTLIERIVAGRPVAHVAAEMGISRATAYKWWARFRGEGWTGLDDRSSRPHRSPHRTPRQLERRIEALRRSRKLGPVRIGGILQVAHATVHRVLVRLGLNQLTWMDRPSGRVIRRIHTDRPGELVHVDVKKLGRIPAGGGWRAHGRGNVAHHTTTKVGYAYVHSAIDAFSRIAYSEILDDERGDTCAGFWTRANTWFAEHGITVERVLTDNARNYVDSRAFHAALGDITHSRIRPRRPQTNGKVERFNRTLLDEWAYVRIYRSDHARTQALTRWLHLYNHHRAHTALGGQTPMATVSNLPGHYS